MVKKMIECADKPRQDQVLAWDPDFTKATPIEDAEMEQAIRELEAGEYVLDGDINWD